MRESTITIVFISVSKLVSVTRGVNTDAHALVLRNFRDAGGKTGCHVAGFAARSNRTLRATRSCSGAKRCRDRTMRRRWGRASMSRPERGKGGCHAREDGWLALSTLVLQYQRHISRVLRPRADADAAHAQDIAHMDRYCAHGPRTSLRRPAASALPLRGMPLRRPFSHAAPRIPAER
jgi:hypothetical protein